MTERFIGGEELSDVIQLSGSQDRFGVGGLDDVEVIGKVLEAAGFTDVVEEVSALRLIEEDVNLVPRRVDVAYLHGRSWKDDSEVLEFGAELVRSGRAKHLLIDGSLGERFNGNVPGEAWPGRTDWVQRLVYKFGVPVDSIYFTEPTYNTRQDTDAFLKTAGEWGWETGVFVTLPHQILRAYLGTVKALENSQDSIDVFAMMPRNVNWSALVFGSQGADELPRWKHILEESKRIPVYQAKGDLSTYGELAAHIRARNERMRSVNI